MDTRASWLALFAVLVVSTTTTAVGATTVTDSCCDVLDGSVCCPEPSIEDLAANLLLPDESKLRIVYDPVRCCSDGSSGAAVGCTAYGTAGCTFCRNVCGEDDDSCVRCSVADSSSAHVSPTPTPTPTPIFGAPEATDDLMSVLDGVVADFDDIETSMTAVSYDLSDDPEQYDCSTCSWDNMSSLEQRLLTQRSRSMVCDSSCLQDSGDANYGVTLCNYFNAGKECRACCHEGHMVDGCMPCEGKGSCESCITDIIEMCTHNPCEADCQAHVCCSVQWGEYSGCEETMHYEMAELAEYISDRCSTFFTCETINPTCSDNARTCTATSDDAVGRRVQEVTHKRCRVLKVTGAGIFNKKYTAAGVFGNELIFRAFGDAKHFALQSVAIDACTGLDKFPAINAASAEILVARSSTGSLAWDDGTEPHPHVMNTGVGCPRHVWFLQDTAGTQDHVFVTVDQSEHPHFISSDWVRVDSDGKMTRTDLNLSCTKEKKQNVKF